MILQVLADSFELVHDADSVSPEFIRGTDTGEQQKLRRTECSAAKDHLARGFGCPFAPVAAVAQAGRALAVKDDSGDLRVRNDREVRPVHYGMQIGGCGRAAFAVPVAAPELGDLIEPSPLLFRSVEIAIATDLVFRAGFDKSRSDRPRAALVRDAQRAVTAMKIIGAALVAFRALEVRQDLLP